MAISESRIRRIIREEARRVLREGEGDESLSFGQPELKVYEESLEITFPYTLGGESGEEKLDYSNLEDAKADPEAVLDRFAEECRHLAFRADESIEDEARAEQFVKDVLLGSSDFDMEKFRSELEGLEVNRFDAEF